MVQYIPSPWPPFSDGTCMKLQGYCGYVDPASGQGVCTAEGNGSFAYPFAPMDAILAEIPSQYRVTAQFLVPPSKFRDSGYERRTSHAGFYFIFIGSVATGVTFLAFVIVIISLGGSLTNCATQWAHSTRCYIYYCFRFKYRVISGAAYRRSNYDSTDSTNTKYQQVPGE